MEAHIKGMIDALGYELMLLQRAEKLKPIHVIELARLLVTFERKLEAALKGWRL